MKQLDMWREIIVDNFAGGGGASTGIEMATGMSVDIAINHDPAAIEMHKLNHPDTEHYCESVWDVDPKEAARGRKVGLCWLSPDCFPAETLVLTSEGYKPIEEIQIGDMVLTHNQRWRKVTSAFPSEKTLIELKGHGHYGLKVSPEHPFYVKHRKNVWNNKIRQYRPEYTEVDWVSASALEKDWYWSSPTIIPTLPIPAMVSESYQGRTITVDERLMWLAGRYVGDGWTRITKKRGELVITCGKQDVAFLKEKLEMWPRKGDRCKDGELAWYYRDVRTGGQFSTSCKSLVEWLREHFGHLGENKKIPGWLYGASESFKQSFLDGYLGADGWTGEDIYLNEIKEATTISKKLAFGLKQLINMMGLAVSVHASENHNTVIEGREVNAKPIYRIKWRPNPSEKHSQTFIDNDLLFAPIKERKDLGVTETVYNISVEEDESYVVEGIVVHNCTHHSKAKGGKPVKKEIRGLAWIAVKWAIDVKPRCIMLENVEEFQDWGPISDEGKPIKELKGQTFESFVKALEALGYEVQFKVLQACDYGAPTTRKRFFMVARCDGKGIAWPEPTHGNPKSLEVQAGHKKPWRTAGDIIDWSIGVPSIFERKKPLVENTMRRIERGLKKFVVDAAEPFQVPDEHIESFLISYYTEQNDEVRGLALDQPLHTITAGGNRFAIVYAYLISYYTERKDGEVRGNNLDNPLHTVTTKDRFAIVYAWLTKYYGQSDAASLEEPLHTLTAGGNRFALTTMMMEKGVVDIGMRMLQPHELYAAQGFPEDYQFEFDANGKKIPHGEKIKRVGNSVPPPFAEALVRANLPEFCAESSRYAVGV